MTVIFQGDCMAGLRLMPDQSVNTCVTSPPYFGLRDYGHAGQIGLEETPDAFVARLVEVFREVRRVLRDDGTLWLNLGDSYASSPRGNKPGDISTSSLTNPKRQDAVGRGRVDMSKASGLAHKQLIGIPWRVAFALQADGWYLRQDIIWHKPNPMPESVKDRCTKAHEYIFLLSKSDRYYFDADAIREPHARLWDPLKNGGSLCGTDGRDKAVIGGHGRAKRAPSAPNPLGRNRRSVWTVTTKPYAGAHFATFPPDLIEPCVLAGAPPGGVVFDPFMGSGTTAAVAAKHGRLGMGCELNPEYVELIRQRVGAVTVVPT